MWARCEELYNKKLWHQVLTSYTIGNKFTHN